jgi:hypothetical protein
MSCSFSWFRHHLWADFAAELPVLPFRHHLWADFAAELAVYRDSSMILAFFVDESGVSRDSSMILAFFVDELLNFLGFVLDLSFRAKSRNLMTILVSFSTGVTLFLPHEGERKRVLPSVLANAQATPSSTGPRG